MGMIKIEVHGRPVEVDESFSGMSEDEQHKVIDEIAAGFGTVSPAAETEKEEPSTLANVGGGALATGLRYGVGVPGVMGANLLKKGISALDDAPSAAPKMPSNVPGEERWFNSANKINEKAKIIRRNTALAERYPQFERAIPPTPPVSAGQKAMTGLDTLRTHPGGKAFSSGYNAMDALQHAGEGPVGNVQAGASAIGAVAPYIEKYLPSGKAKKIAKAFQLGAPAANYVIDKFTGKPVPAETEQKATGGLIHLADGGGPKLPGKLGKAVSLAQKAAHEFGHQEPGKMSDWAQQHTNKFLVPTQADRMGFVGGPSYSANQLVLPQYKGRAWGSGQKGTATEITNIARDPRFGGAENQIFAPILGGEKMHQSNQIIFDRMVEDFYKHPEKLTPELRTKINEYIQSGGLIGGKKSGFDPIPDFDIADRGQVEELGKTFDTRKIIAQHGFGGLGIGSRKSQIIPYEQILKETTDPTVLGAKTYSVGPRAFSLTGEVEQAARPDLNPAYPFQLHGQDLGVTYSPVPSELSLMDFQKQWRKDLNQNTPTKTGKLPEPGYFEYTRGYKPAGSDERIYPRQQITEDWIKELQRSGFAPGGKVSAAKKLLEEAQAAYKAKFTPGFYHGSPSNKITAFDASKGDRSFPTEGVTFLTKEPDFAHSFIDVHKNRQTGGWDYDKGSTIYPVSANLGKHFDPATPEGSESIKQYLMNKYRKEADANYFDDTLNKKHEYMMDKLTDPVNNWKLLESPGLLDHLKNTGHNSFSVTEGGIKNVGVFEPQNIRGKFAKFDPEEAASPDFMKAKGGLARIKK